MPELWIIFVTGLAASLHCVGMCGPIVMGLSGAAAPVQIDLGGAASVGLRKTVVMPQVLYHSGRVISYSSIGAISGMIGTVTMITPRVQQIFTIAFGALMIAAGLFQLNVFTAKKAAPGKISSMLGSLVRTYSSESRFLVGLLTPLLPCGLLYGMALHAAAGHSIVNGAAEMGVFSLGAVPALMILATMTSAFGTKLRAFGTRFAAILIVTMGILTILRGAGLYADPFGRAADPSCCKTQTQVFSHQ